MTVALLFALAEGCREAGGSAARATDTPALLRVIARAHGEYAPLPRPAHARAALRVEKPVRLSRREGAAADSAADVASVPLAPLAPAAPVAEPPAGGPLYSIKILPGTATLRVGETATLALEALDSAGSRTYVPAARWRPANAAIVRLDRMGAVTATAPGVTTLEAWVGTVRATARIEVLPLVRGRLFTLEGETPPGMQVGFKSASFTDSVVVGADGRFEFRPPEIFPDTAELWIRAVDAGPRRYHTMVAKLTAVETGPELRAVMVPTRWTVRSGAYAGVTVDVSAEVALRRWRGAAPFARSAAYEGRRTRRVVGWPSQSLPLPVAFVRERATASISAADSAVFWGSVRRFEQHLGMTAFRPADTSALGEGRPGVEVVVDPRIPPAAVTWASWGPSGDLNDARVAVRTAADFRDASLVAHEMLHALGFGHALEWRSVMTRTASAGVTSLTAQDVAYVQLIYRVRAAQAAFGADLGFLEAAEGERRAVR